MSVPRFMMVLFVNGNSVTLARIVAPIDRLDCLLEELGVSWHHDHSTTKLGTVVAS